MEGRDSSANTSNIPGPNSFSAILQRTIDAHHHSGASESTNLGPSNMPHGLHAPSPMRRPLGFVHHNSMNHPTTTTTINTNQMPAYTSEMGSNLSSHMGVGQHAMHVGDIAGRSVPLVSKRKRGRPRKYGPDGSMATLALVSHPVSAPGAPASATATAPATAQASSSAASPSVQKRGRGRPPGSGKKQQLAARERPSTGTAGVGFTPHVITIAAGEDVAMKIMSLSQLGSCAVCILSANGAVSNITLRQPATSGGTVTYEGRFEILSLSGSFLPMESGNIYGRTGGLSVSLAGPDGRVIGGGVAGLLMAASPVQVVVGTFVSEEEKSRSLDSEGSLPSDVQGLNVNAPAAPGMHHSMNQSLAKFENPSHSHGSTTQQHPPHPQTHGVFHPVSWTGSDTRHNSYVNISLPGD